MFGIKVANASLEVNPRRLAPEFVAFAGMEATRRALGQPPIEVSDSVHTTEFRLDDSHSGAILAQGVSQPEKYKVQLGALLEGVWQENEAWAAASAYREVRGLANSVRRSLDEYLLLHHIRGRCRLCRKLSG
jgi:hypothetical protein